MTSWPKGGQRGGGERGGALLEGGRAEAPEAPRSVGPGQPLGVPAHVASLTQPYDSRPILAQLFQPQARGRIF